MAQVGEVFMRLILQTKEAEDEMERATENVKRGLSDMDKKAQESGGIIRRVFRAATLPLRNMLSTTNRVANGFRRLSRTFKNEGESMLETGQELTIGLAGPFFLIGAAAVYAFSQTKEGASTIERLKAAFEDALSVMAPMGRWLVMFAFELLPRLKAILQQINDWFMSLSETQRKWVVYIALAISAVGPLITVLGAYAYLIGFIGTLLSTLISRFGLVIAVVTALAGAFIYAYNNVAWFRDIVDQAVLYIQTLWQQHGSTIISTIQTAYEFIKNNIMTVLNAILAFVGWVLDTILMWWDEHGQSVISSVTSFMQWIWSGIIVPVFQELVAFIKSMLDKIVAWWEEHGSNVRTAVQNIMTIVWTGFDMIMSIIKGTFEFLKPFLKAAWDGIKTIFSGALDVILGLLGVFVNLFAGDWKGLWESVKQIFTGVWGIIKGLLQGVFGSILALFASFAKSVINKVKEIKNSITNYFKSLGKDALAWGRNLLDSFINGITSRFARLRSAVSNAVSIVKNFLGFSSPTKKGPGREADEWPVNLVNTFAEGMTATLPNLERALIKTAQTLSILAQPVAITEGPMPAPTFNGPLVNIENAVIRNEDDIRKLSEQVAEELRRMWDDIMESRGL